MRQSKPPVRTTAINDILILLSDAPDAYVVELASRMRQRFRPDPDPQPHLRIVRHPAARGRRSR